MTEAVKRLIMCIVQMTIHTTQCCGGEMDVRKKKTKRRSKFIIPKGRCQTGNYKW